MENYLYLVCGVLLVAAIVISQRRGNHFKAKNISGSTVVNGDVRGGVIQTTSVPGENDRPNKPDRVAWIIGITAVLVATAQLVHDLLK